MIFLLEIATIWGKIQGKAEQEEKPMPAIDSLIAATGIFLNCIVVTRNVLDMEQSGVKLLNPSTFSMAFPHQTVCHTSYCLGSICLPGFVCRALILLCLPKPVSIWVPHSVT